MNRGGKLGSSRRAFFARYGYGCGCFVWLLVTCCGDPTATSSAPSVAGLGGDAGESSTNSGGPGPAGGRSSAGADAAAGESAVSSFGGTAGDGGSLTSDGGETSGEEGLGGAGNGGASGGAGNGGASGGGQPSFACVERGTRCATLDDCSVGQMCVNGACTAGKPLGDPCTGEEYCGRDVRCVEGTCTYRYSIQYSCIPDYNDPTAVAPDAWLHCKPGTYCGSWTSLPADGQTCGSGKDGAWCASEPCALGYYCRPIPDPGSAYSEYRCERRLTAGDSCTMDARRECDAGFVCNWVVTPERLGQPNPPTQVWGCVPPGHEGDYCDPDYPEDFESFPSFPSQCGPNLYCDDDAAPDAPVPYHLFGRCVPVPEPTKVQVCTTTDDCPLGKACKDFFPGFLTCGELLQEGASCDPDERYSCDDGLVCLRDSTAFSAPRFGRCTRVAQPGDACDAATFCADDGACVAR